MSHVFKSNFKLVFKIKHQPPSAPPPSLFPHYSSQLVVNIVFLLSSCVTELVWIQIKTCSLQQIASRSYKG